MEEIWYVIGVGGVVAILVWAFATLKGDGQASKAAQAEILKLTSDKIKIESEHIQLKGNYQEIEKELQILRNFKNENAVLLAKFDDQKFNLNELKNKYEILESKNEHLLLEKEAKSSEVIKLSTQLETERMLVTQLHSDKNNLTSKLGEKEEILSNLKAECIKLSATNEILTTQLNENAKNSEQMRASLSFKEKENSELEKEKRKLEEQIHEYKRLQKESQEHGQELIKQRALDWKNHESRVKEELKKIAMRCEVEIPKTPPFHGVNDNCVKINGEYVIFEARAPKNIDHLEKYLHEQIKRINKYINESMVKKEAFLIVPDSVLNEINNISEEIEGNNVSIIPLCSVEPLIRNMKVVENFHQLEKLSPDERDKLIQFISKSTSAIKQKIKVDQAYSLKFFEIIDEAKKLPKEFLNSNQSDEIQETDLTKLHENSTSIDHLLDEEEIPPFIFDGPEKKAS
jgi:DNA repair exonuclease SbcCD ATPase subunit